jgi:predicted metal-binding protein
MEQNGGPLLLAASQWCICPLASLEMEKPRKRRKKKARNDTYVKFVAVVDYGGCSGACKTKSIVTDRYGQRKTWMLTAT